LDPPRRSRLPGFKEPQHRVGRDAEVRCQIPGVPQILVGVNRVGIVGLREALARVAESGLTGREEIVDALLEDLAGDNYIPAGRRDDFRIALWREYLRSRNEDFRAFFSEIDVTVAGAAGPDRDEFLDMLHAVFNEFELRPVVTFAPPAEDGPNPQLIIDDDIIVRGLQSRHSFKKAAHKSISDW
jgi:hypothetical protein